MVLFNRQRRNYRETRTSPEALLLLRGAKGVQRGRAPGGALAASPAALGRMLAVGSPLATAQSRWILGSSIGAARSIIDKVVALLAEELTAGNAANSATRAGLWVFCVWQTLKNASEPSTFDVSRFYKSTALTSR